MSKTLIAILLFAMFSFAQFAEVFTSATKAPKGCIKRGDLVKCAVKETRGAGKIYSAKTHRVYWYYPKAEGQTEMFAINQCDSIVVVVDVELAAKALVAVASGDTLTAIKNGILAEQAMKNGDYTLMCNQTSTKKLEVFCQPDGKRAYIVKYDELGIEKSKNIKITNNPNYCTEQFQKVFNGN